MDLLNLFRNEQNVSLYARTDVIFTEGAPGEHMYVLLDGKIELSVRGSAFQEITAGEMFGEMALINSLPRSATAVAKTDCKLIPFDQAKFKLHVQLTPMFSLQVMRTMAHRLQSMNTHHALA